MRRIGPFLVTPNPSPSWGWSTIVSLLAIAGALVAAGGVFWAYGVAPLVAYRTMAEGTFLDPRALPEVVRRAIPLLLVGSGLVLAFRAQFWNIGAEGQILSGAVAATGVALFSPLPPALLIPGMFVAGFALGALWAAVPALLRLRWGAHEVLTTLLLNYVAAYGVEWLVHGPWKGSSMMGFAYTDLFPEAAWLPLLGTTRMHWPTLALGLGWAIFGSVLLSRTVLGFEIRVQGENPEAARYAGIPATRTVLAVALLSGGAAGLAGVGEVAGIHHRLLSPGQISMGYGYAGILVAWLARGNPLGAIPSAFLLGLVFTSGDVMQVALQMPFRVTDVFNGLLLLFLVGSTPLLQMRIRRVSGAGGEAWTSSS
ncbi:MAG: ABC transporter permease [Armatimonadetes bacterium]|nr:ABC transporter permease [Armatimonadota bacterium]MDW8152758.1 ABC transporter permease [Armatimonadota bacterium]